MGNPEYVGALGLWSTALLDIVTLSAKSGLLRCKVGQRHDENWHSV